MVDVDSLEDSFRHFLHRHFRGSIPAANREVLSLLLSGCLLFGAILRTQNTCMIKVQGHALKPTLLNGRGPTWRHPIHIDPAHPDVNVISSRSFADQICTFPFHALLTEKLNRSNHASGTKSLQRTERKVEADGHARTRHVPRRIDSNVLVPPRLGLDSLSVRCPLRIVDGW